MLRKNTNPNALALFTSEGENDIREKGGSSAWKGSPVNMGRMEYLVLIQNRKYHWGTGTHPHGTLFLIGKIIGVEEVEDDPGRFLILINLDQVALCDIPHAWPGHENPIFYTTLKDLGVDEATLTWQSLLPNTQPQTIIEDAKERLAKELGIRVADIQIVVSY